MNLIYLELVKEAEELQKKIEIYTEIWRSEEFYKLSSEQQAAFLKYLKSINDLAKSIDLETLPVLKSK